MSQMRDVLNFAHRLRPTPFAKELLELPCMKSSSDNVLVDYRHSHGALWRKNYAKFPIADVSALLRIADLQAERLEVNCAEDSLDVANVVEDSAQQGPARPAGFAQQDVFALPSAYINHLLSQLPPEEKLTRDQILFILK